MISIAIIGGGWTGCHLAASMMNEAKVTLFEKNAWLISEASLINQNRLHYGYHYARDGATRRLCQATFHRFIADYGHVVQDVPRNFYAVPEKESLLDAETLSLIFKDWPHQETKDHPLVNTSLVIDTQEKFISSIKAGKYFDDLLDPIVVYEEINQDDLPLLKNDYDFVFDCTNNALLQPSGDCFFEHTMMAIYKPKQNLPFEALTYIDGPLFSVYPYSSSLYSLSHVEHGILSQSANFPSHHWPWDDLRPHRDAMEQHIKQYWPAFDDFLKFEFTCTSTKAKTKNKSANRTPIFKAEDNLLSMFTGKIQGIYAIEAMARQFIDKSL